MLAFNSRDHIEALSQHSQDAQDLHDADEGMVEIASMQTGL